MGKISFFFRQNQIYEMSLKALERRNFAITEANEEKGIIRATSRGNFLKPAVKMELFISQIDERQTSVKISSKIRRKWLSPAGYDETAEARFIRTLYNCIDTA